MDKERATLPKSVHERKQATSNLPGSDTKGVMTAEELLDRADKSPRLRLKGDTLVIGSDSQAMTAARTALRCGSENVVVVCLEKNGEWQAPAEEVEQTKSDGARIIHGWGPTRVESYRDGRVSGVYFHHCEKAFDGEGNLSPVFDDANIMAQYCDNLVL